MPLSGWLISDIRWMRGELNFITREHAIRPPDADRQDLLLRASETLRASRDLRIDDLIVETATGLAKLLNDTGRPADALRVINENEPLPDSLAGHPLAVAFGREHVRALAAEARAESDAAKAETLWREIDNRTAALIDLVEPLRSRVSVPNLSNAYTRFSIQIYALAIEARLATGDPVGALQRIELVKCRSIHRLQQGLPPAANSLCVREDFRRLSDEIDVLQKNGGPASEELLRRLAKRRAIWDLLAIDRFAERGEFAEFDLTMLHARLPVGTVAISWFWLDRERLVIAAIGRDHTVVVIQPVAEAIRTEIDEKAKKILSFDDKQSTNITKLRMELTDVLIPSSIRPVTEGAKRLILSPHRSLHALPLHALQWGEPRRPLIRRFAVSYVPNLTTLLRSRAVEPHDDVLFVGVPRRAPELKSSPLDGAERELTALRDCYGAGRLSERCGPAATEAELERLNESGKLADFGAVHIACHGVNIDSDNPMESRLLLYDSNLDGLDICDWRLQADIVVLSACSSGQRPVSGRGLPELPGDELFGLQAAFFAAGARQILATQWPVRDDIAPFICAAFHGYRRQHPTDVALQMALCDYLDFDRLAEGTPHSWACFFLTVARMPDAL